MKQLILILSLIGIISCDPAGETIAQTEEIPRLQGIQGIQGLQGSKGENGSTGPQGIQGPQGSKGEDGPVGPQGIQGPRGESELMTPTRTPVIPSSRPVAVTIDPIEPAETEEETQFEEEVREALLARQQRIAAARGRDNNRYPYYVIHYDESLNEFSDGERAVKDARSSGSGDMLHHWSKYNDELEELEEEGVILNSYGLLEINNVFDDELFEIQKEINVRTDFSDREVIEDILRRIDEIIIRNRFALKRYVDKYR